MTQIRLMAPSIVIGFVVTCVTVYPSIAQGVPRVRRNYKTEQTTAAGRQRLADFVAAIKALKAVDPNANLPALGYNDFVRMHADFANGSYAHKGADFLAWHRIFMLRFEDALRTVNSNQFPDVTIPYWDWTVDPFPRHKDPTANAGAGDDLLMGPDGNPSQNYEVTAGPFSFVSGGWTCYNGGSKLKRRLGGGSVPSLPTPCDVACALQIDSFDSGNFDTSSSFNYQTCSSCNPQSITSFRNFLEGFIGSSGLHNSVHLWVGGGVGHMGSVPTAINDPVFWMHHANVDRIWCQWQGQNFGNQHYFQHQPLGGKYDPVDACVYPNTPGACHHVFDPMPPFCVGADCNCVGAPNGVGELPPQAMPFDALNMNALNYEYDTCQGACVYASGTYAGLTTAQANILACHF
jgi:tyrosinase